MTKKVIQINKNPVYDIGMVTTVFSKDTEFFGDLSFKKSLQINGYFEGEIVSGGFLVVGEGAVVKANIRAKTVILMGTVSRKHRGHVSASKYTHPASSTATSGPRSSRSPTASCSKAPAR